MRSVPLQKWICRYLSENRFPGKFPDILPLTSRPTFRLPLASMTFPYCNMEKQENATGKEMNRNKMCKKYDKKTFY
jgi:hypothetical protein